ncbi:MAG: T9SS type A sorting domain-containing protein [Bacteroidetes bacterium]|nr:T9SS type A sorting domain-containing protein [Bacteroidota bacterium]
MKNSILITICFLSVLLFNRSTANAQTTYKDVVPVFIENCNDCHRSGSIGFPLTSYSDVLPWGSSIVSAVQSNHMPPWPADPLYKNYVHERIVSQSDKTLLIDWINNGMLAGDTTLAPPLPIYNATQLGGTPDLILNLPKFISTATASDHYYCMNVPIGLLQDRYIRAFEFVPGNAPIIHHAVITIDTTGNAVDDFSGNCFNQQGQIGIGDYAPGMGPTVLPGIAPAKFGFRLKAGSKMSFQIHVPEGTAGQQDSSQLRIYFYPIGESGIRDMYFETVLQNWNFFVPANASVTVGQKYPPGNNGLPVNVSLYGAFPHSHKTCTSILNYAYNNNDTLPLIRINEWDFHWQMQYTFKKMVKVPAGYHLYASHIFDNTINNPHTPDHNSPVLPGTNTFDEMLFDSYLYTLYQPGDENINIDSLLQNDPLFAPTSNTDRDQTVSTIKIYPNPTDDFLHIDYKLNTTQFVSINIMNLQGQPVADISGKIETPGFQRHTWNGCDARGNKMPSGIYMYTIQAGRKVSSGKIFLK